MVLRLSRREFLAAATASAAARSAAAQARQMSAREAHAMASAREVVLLDIRTPGEWRRTGVGEHAVALSMHEPGFIERLDRLVAGDRSRPIALICASGGRSRRMQAVLAAAGFRRVIDVAEGMEGGAAGDGWVASGLPVRPVRP